MYKLFSIDLDKTLLNDDNKISEEDKKAINYAKSKGYIICVNTGRNYASSINICKEIGADFLIYLHGCFVYDAKKCKYVRNRIISFLWFLLYYTLPYMFIANKLYGLNFLCNHLGISLKQTVSIGDHYSDIKMIKKSGLGIGVLNSVWELKYHADFVIQKSNNNSAVSEAIYYTISKEE